MKIVSVVPSQTELLYDLGLDEEVTGITKFCVHPQHWFNAKTRVGGTKTLDIDKIIAIGPDLIIANKEENQKEQIEILSAYSDVYVSDISNVQEALNMITTIGQLTGKQTAAIQLSEDIQQGIDSFRRSSTSLRVAYGIWYNPWMFAGMDTFISNMISDVIGWKNVLHDKQRYPVLTLQELHAYQPELILLSSEPFPFKQKHAGEIRRVIPDAEILFVDGEMFSWYGSRMKPALKYLQELVH